MCVNDFLSHCRGEAITSQIVKFGIARRRMDTVSWQCHRCEPLWVSITGRCLKTSRCVMPLARSSSENFHVICS